MTVDPTKITRSHLERLAVVHVRQSTPLQVSAHQESRLRQYALGGRAREMGWPVATEVEANASDQGRLVPMLDKVNDAFGVEPEVVLADAGYCNEADLATLERRGIDGHVALGREGKARAAVDPRTRPATCRMGEKLAGTRGRARYAERKWMSEAPNGWIKEALGFRRFSLRGAGKVRSEWHLVCLALNVRRMAALAA